MSNRQAAALEKAGVLVDALPWLERFHGKTVVLKFGGNAFMSQPDVSVMTALTACTSPGGGALVTASTAAGAASSACPCCAACAPSAAFGL